MSGGRQAITRQAAIRLFFSLGLFVMLVGASTAWIYRAAITKAASESAEDQAQFYRTRFDQLEREWELLTRDMRVRIEYTRALETPETATVQLQAFLTIQESDRRFYHLQIEDRDSEPLFTFGKELEMNTLPLGDDAVSGYYYDARTQSLYRIFTDRIWLGERGMGRIALFFSIDNALLQQLATPGVTLAAYHGETVVASSAGERGIADERSGLHEGDARIKRKSLPWSMDDASPLNITISAPVKVLFSTTELALAVSVIPVIDALILWFVLGTWLMRQARRINGLGDAVREFAGEERHEGRLVEQLSRARDGVDDEIHDVADTIAEMVEQNKQRDKERRLWELVFANSNEAILITDTNNRIIAINPTFTELTGYTPEEIVGFNPSILSSGESREGFYEEMWQKLRSSGQWQGEIVDRRKDGSLYPKWLSIATVKDEQGEISNYVGTFVDITERKRNEERIIHLATHDVLTGLANRMLLLEHIQKGIAYAKRRGGLMALLFLDLDRFKWINDSLGHEQGDRLLKGISRRLLDTVRDSDTVARLGGDEFVIVLNDINEMSDAAATASKIIEQIAYPFTLSGREFHVTTSVGISLYPNDGNEADQLLKNADAAMYSAKAAGKNQASFFDVRMNQSAVERFEIENGLREALASQQLQLHFQPKLCLHDSVCGGAEALLRWHHPTFGQVAPDRFIPIAEETGLIITIGEWVLRHACEQLHSWQQAGIDPGIIAINISAQQLESPNFSEIVVDILREYQIDPTCVEFELTESAILQNPQQSIAVLEALRGLGIRLSLDDFGTGYSSLAYLKRLPVDTVKIDRSFIDGLPNDEDDAQIVRMTVAMAKSIGLMVVAEGVENPSQLDYLKQIGCDLLQGFYISRPLPAEEYGRWLVEQGRRVCGDLAHCGEKRCGVPVAITTP